MYIYIFFFYLLRYEQQRVVKDQIASEIAKTISLFYVEEQQLPSGTKGRTSSRSSLSWTSVCSVFFRKENSCKMSGDAERAGQSRECFVFHRISFSFRCIHRSVLSRMFPLVRNDELSLRTWCLSYASRCKRTSHESVWASRCSCARHVKDAKYDSLWRSSYT